MIFNDFTAVIASKTIRAIRKKTKFIGHGEAVAICVWWRFINDHAQCEGHDPKQLARDQLEAFLESGMVKVID